MDANILVSFFIRSDYSEAIWQLRNTDPEWIAPFLWRSEMRNALTLFVRKQILPLEHAVGYQQAAERLMQSSECWVDSKLVLELTTISRCSAYDCEYVAAAKTFESRLYTLDKKVLREFPDIALSPAG